MLTDKEQDILDSIIVASDNDPQRPEFPHDHPKFPATPTVRLQILGYTNIWVKDESQNPTGTHKDRMAWEIVVTYRDLLVAKKNGLYHHPDLPHMSLISSGSAAFAIQSLLKKFTLPHLKVLLDKNTNPEICAALLGIGAEVFLTDLSIKMLNAQDILDKTNNPDGHDITSSTALDPDQRFYDWLSYEIINNSPEYCFIPFGSGTLFTNILKVSKHTISSEVPDPRFFGDMEALRGCHFIGSTTHDTSSKADKLYSPFLPFSSIDTEWLQWYRQLGYCGQESRVKTFTESYLDEALDIFAKNNIEVEPSGAAGLALFLEMKDSIPSDARIVVVNTGRTKFELAREI